MVFGIIAYFLYKTREKKKESAELTYEKILEDEDRDLLYFTKGE